MKRILQIGMIVVVFLSTIGVPVYHHVCITESEYSNSILFELTSCSDKHEAHTQPSCCERDVAQKHAHSTIDLTCCEDNVSTFQLPFFGINYSFPIIVQEVRELSIFDYLQKSDLLVAQTITDFSLKDPPNFSTLERLAQLCIWRL